MDERIRNEVVALAERFGFRVETDEQTGLDVYDKQLKFAHFPSGFLLFVNKEIDHTKSGFKIGVHPEHFFDDLCNDRLVSIWLARKGSRLSPHSAYRGFPPESTQSKEPCAICYRVMGIPALKELLAEVSRRWGGNVKGNGSTLIGTDTLPSPSGINEGNNDFVGSKGSGPEDSLATTALPSTVENSSAQRVDDNELGGTGYESDPKIRRSIELYAVAKARRYYEDHDYSVTEYGKPFDLLCEKAGEVVHVEVKGSRYALDAIIVTTNEVKDARNTDWRTDLFLVENIALELDGQDGFNPSGGHWLVARNWMPEDQDLSPMQYRYKLPPIFDAE